MRALPVLFRMLSFQWTTPGLSGHCGHSMGRLVHGAALLDFAALAMLYLTSPTSLQCIFGCPRLNHTAHPES